MPLFKRSKEWPPTPEEKRRWKLDGEYRSVQNKLHRLQGRQREVNIPALLKAVEVLEAVGRSGLSNGLIDPWASRQYYEAGEAAAKCHDEIRGMERRMEAIVSELKSLGYGKPATYWRQTL